MRAAIHDREEQAWKESLINRPKLRTYRVLKHKLELEHYLLDNTHRYGRYEL